MTDFFKVKQKKGNSREVCGSMKNYFFKVKQKRNPRGGRVYEKLCFQSKAKNKICGGRVADL